MASSRSAVKDLTEGRPMSLILGFALPLFGGMLFQQFYNMVDTLIVGRFLGVSELAGVGSTGSISFMIIGFCIGSCSGFAIPISQRFGAKDYAGMRKFYVHSIYLSAFFAVVLTFFVTIFCRAILTAMNTPSDIYEYAYDYIFVIFAGIPAVFLYNLFSSAIRALGDSKAPVVFLVISSVLNILLDLSFILNFHMGVAGAAWATVVSETVSGILSIIYILKKVPLLRLQKGEGKFQWSYIGRLFTMGVPMGLQYSVTAIGSVVLQTAVNGLGSIYVASMTAGSRVLMFFESPFDALGAAMATWGGQNVGAGKLDRLNKGLGAAAVLGCIYSAVGFVVLFFFGDSLVGLFISEGAGQQQEIMAHGRLFLVCNAAFFVPLLFVNAVRFLIQGMGYPGLAIISGIMEMVGRIAAATILIPRIGFTGACLASPIAWILADSFLFPAYFHVRRVTYRKLGRIPGQTG